MIIVIIAGLLTAGSVVFASDGGTSTNETDQKITMQQAKEIALAEVDGTITSAELDEDNGRSYFEIDINDGTYEYEFEIDAATGKVVDFEKEFKKEHVQQEAGTLLSEEEALAIAKEKAPDATLKEIELEQEKGWQIYDIELMDGNVKYEFEIDAATGEVIDFEKEEKQTKQDKKEVIELTPVEENEATEATPAAKAETESNEQMTSTLTAEDAIAIARQHATGVVTEIERDDNVFEIDMEDGDIEYEIEIDVFTGNVVSFDKDED